LGPQVKLIDHGKFFGSFHFDAALIRNSCGTFLALRYFCVAEFDAVPNGAKTNATCSSSTSLRVCSTVLGGLNESSRLIKLIRRPLMPPRSFRRLK